MNDNPTHGFLPPPHPNAETHKKVMALLRKMTPQEALEMSVRAGVHTPDGRLTPPYRPDDEPISQETLQPVDEPSKP